MRALMLFADETLFDDFSRLLVDVGRLLVILGSVAEEGMRHRLTIISAKDDINSSIDAPVLTLYESVLGDEQIVAEFNQLNLHLLVL